MSGTLSQGDNVYIFFRVVTTGLLAKKVLFNVFVEVKSRTWVYKLPLGL